MKRILKVTSVSALLLSGLILTACSNTKTSQNGGSSASNGNVTVELVKGTYVVPSGESVANNEKYLALDVKVTNKGDSSLYLSSSDFALYDSNNEKVSDVTVYDDAGNFKTISGETLKKGKSVTGYVVYKVEKTSKYELSYAPSFTKYDKNNDDKDVTLPIKASKYEDHTGEVVGLTQEFVNQVFLNNNEASNAKTVDFHSSDSKMSLLASSKSSKSSSSSDKVSLLNNLSNERDNFNNAFISEFGKLFTHYSASQSELKTFTDAYEVANAKRAEIQYSIKSYTPDSAIVYIKPNVIDLASIDTTNIMQSFINQNKSTYNDYNTAYQAAEKYLLEQLPTKLDSTGLATSTYMDGEGYELQLTKDKDSNKWKVNTEDTSDNYQYKYLEYSFMGNIQ